MGTNTSICHNATIQSKDNIIGREMRIYKWRAQNINNFIPNVEFKCTSLIKEQQKWNQFISKYKDKDYLEMNQFKKEIEDLDKSQEPIIAFEKYACNLNQLNYLLSTTQTVYALIALLVAFQQIKQLYTHSIPLDKRCCFVTLRGDVRGWINSNPKSNQIQQNSDYKYFNERQNKEIIKQIVRIVEQLSVKDVKIDSLFLTLHNFIANSVSGSNLYLQTKNFVEGYCRTAGIQPSRNLINALRKSKDIPILKFSRKSLLAKTHSLERKNKSNEHSNKPTSTVSERQAGHRISFQHQQQHAKHSKPQSTLASFVCFNQPFTPKEDCLGTPFLFKREPLHSRRLSEIQAPKSARTEEQRNILKVSQILPSTPKPRVSVQIDWNYQKKKQASISQNISESNPSNFQQSQKKYQDQGTLLDGKFLTSRELTNFNLPKHRREHKYRTSNLENKVLKQISILDIGDQNTSNKENQGKKVHFHTSQDVKSSDTSIEPPPRPWITSKTISQLISDKDEGDSLVHSRGTSSEDCAPSSYSGALSTMGRQVSMIKKKGHYEAQAQ